MRETSSNLILLYHFFHPDDVISARLFSDIAEEVAREGDSVVAMPSVRSCHDGEAAYAKLEVWKGVTIRRVWRPDWRQGSNKGRIGNALFMLLGWSWRAVWTWRSKNETVVIGTDPPLSVLVAIPWRLFRPRAKIIHWCHDLYPQAAIAEGILKSDSWSVKLLNALLRVAYARCDVIADLGECMRRELLAASGAGLGETGESPSPPTPLPGVPGRGEKSSSADPLADLGRGEPGQFSTPAPSVLGRGEKSSDADPIGGLGRGEKNLRTVPLGFQGRGEMKTVRGLGDKYVTLTPWALVEPEGVLDADAEVRRGLFGEAKLGLLYSGNLGRAHVYEPFVELARRVAGDSIAFCFAGRGAGMERLEEVVRGLGAGNFETSIRGEQTDETSAVRGKATMEAGSEAAASGSDSPSPPTPLPFPGRGEEGLDATPLARVLGRGEPGQFSTPAPSVLGRRETGSDKEMREREEEEQEEEKKVEEEREEESRRRSVAAHSVRFAGFASEEELGKRLGAADVHMVSLAPNWTGTVVPSKFFGALAVGRPVLFAGSRESAIARWIEEFGVGWVLDDEASVERVAGELRAFAVEPERVKAMREHCFQIYHREFSKAVQLGKWKKVLEIGDF